MVSRSRLVQSPGESESFAGAAATAGAAGAAAADAEFAGVALTRLEAGQFGACQVRHHVLVPLLYPAAVHLTQPEVTN